MRVVVVGCGNIAEPYTRDLIGSGAVELAGFHDLRLDRASALATSFGGMAFETLDEAIAAADLIVNLTIFEAHYPVSKAALETGRHVYSEKPLAMSLDDARELAEIADLSGVRLVAAPFTFLGNAQRKTIRAIRNGELGETRLVNAEVNHGRIETWHPNPEPFYRAGPLLDVGVYPLAFVTAALGPVERLTAISKTILEDRSTVDGVSFSPGAPDYWLLDMDLAGGANVRLTANFYVHGEENVTFHGDLASLRIESWFSPEAEVVFTPYEAEPVIVHEGDDTEIDWAAGVNDLVTSIVDGTRSALSTDHSVHLVEVLDAAMTSAADHRTVELSTGFELPEL